MGTSRSRRVGRLYFASHIPITLLIDAQAAIDHRHFPEPAQALLDWHIRVNGDFLMVPLRPIHAFASATERHRRDDAHRRRRAASGRRRSAHRATALVPQRRYGRASSAVLLRGGQGVV